MERKIPKLQTDIKFLLQITIIFRHLSYFLLSNYNYVKKERGHMNREKKE